LVVDLFPAERAALLELLQGLSPEAWAWPTVCAGWSVKDIALHVWGDDVGLLSRTADFRFPAGNDFADWAAVLAFINEANDLWVRATRRLNPALLGKYLALSGAEVAQFLATVDLFALGEPVSWAGPEPAPVWFDVAREYTERWLHQQHIRDAVARPGLKSRRWFGPVLDTFVRALPHTFRLVSAAPDTTVQLTISGEAGGVWSLRRAEAGWQLFQGEAPAPTATISMDQEVAWRCFSKGLSPAEAEARSTFSGDRSLGRKVLETVSIIA
jgi:uncharacterized protein (TIGR03083 family)